MIQFDSWNIFNLIINQVNKQEKTTNVDVLRQIKSEMVCSDKISNEMVADALATKVFYDTIYTNKDLNGFVNFVSCAPFGALLISKIQAIIWEKLSQSNFPVWHIDATGSILKNANGKQVKLYTIIN